MSAPCDWCGHMTCDHDVHGCDVVRCACNLSASELGAYSLAIALERFREYWAA